MLGISLGAIYALIALGFVVIYSVSNVINLAQGEFLMLGALIFVAVVDLVAQPIGAGLAVFLGLLVSFIATGAIGGLAYTLAFRPAIDRRASVQTLIIISMGVSIVLRAFGNLMWGVDPTSTPAFLPGRTILRVGKPWTPMEPQSCLLASSSQSMAATLASPSRFLAAFS